MGPPASHRGREIYVFSKSAIASEATRLAQESGEAGSEWGILGAIAARAVAQLPNIDSVRMVMKFNQEFGARGSWYIKKIRDVEYVIFRGRAGFRHVFRGTRMRLDDPRVVKFGLRNATGRGLTRTLVKGGIWSFVFIGAIDVAQFFYDSSTGASAVDATDLGVQLGSDALKAILATVASVAAAAAVGLATASAVVPLAVGVTVAIVVGTTLDILDAQYGVTEDAKKWVRGKRRRLEREGGSFLWRVELAMRAWVQRLYGGMIEIPMDR